MARDALDRTRSFQMDAASILEALATGVRVEPPRDELSRAGHRALEQLEAHIADFQDTIASTSKELHTELSARFEELRANSDYVTVTVFGRTRAGKSTLIEALVRGSGESIGVGRQHTTKDVREYFWPPDTRALRLVDTPGVEGLKGAELALKAQRFVDRSDHILFVVTDDAATSGELEYFREIRTLGKSVTCLLNVKKKDEDLDLLLEHPQLVFRDDELAGHRRRIQGYLAEQLDDDELVIVPLHARAGWLATREEDASRARALWESSRIAEAENRIMEFVVRDGVVARLSSPRQLLASFVLGAIDDLAGPLGSLRALLGSISEQARATEVTLRKLRRYAADERRSALRGADEILAGIPGAVDDLIAVDAEGDALEQRYDELYERAGVGLAAERYRERVLAEFKRALDEQATEATLDVKLGVSLAGLTSALDDAKELRASAKWHRAGRVGIQAAGGTAAGALATWAIANWWNPTGLAAGAAAAVCVAAASFGGQRGAKVVSDAWAKADAAKLERQRDRIVDELTDRTEAERRRVERMLADWEKAFFAGSERDLLGSLSAVTEHIDAIGRAIYCGVRELKALLKRIDDDLVHQAAALACPEVSAGVIAIEAVHRAAGFGTKIRVRAREAFGSPLGACLGRGGERARALRTALGGDPIAFVDAAATLREQVAMALFPARVRAEDVHVPRRSSSPIVVTVSPGESARAIGRGGVNIALAQKAVDRVIRVSERAR